jgi:CBS domain-containing protein
VSIRDLVDPRMRATRVTTPVISIGVDEPIAFAARRLAEAGVHHLVVVDGEGRAAGMLSALDVVRALVGLEAKHPLAIASFGREEIQRPPPGT